MAYPQTSLFNILFFLALSASIFAQTNPAFLRSTPEMEGVASEGIQQFVNAFGNSNQELHSFMMLRHGKVIAETWLSPYRPDLTHTMYSVSKSFTATAIGFAVSEHRLTVDDKVISFFPNDLPTTISPYLAELRIRDLLTMSAGHDPEPTGAIITGDSNWVKSFLATPIVHQPGSQFLYNSACTYMLSAIIQKISGEKLIDYLKPRLFQPLDITDIDWEVDPRGINVGGWGFRIKTEDMAKFGQMFLQNGMWKGRQVVPASWVNDASTLKIIQHPNLPQTKRDSSDWEQGYCYQMWRCKNNAYRGDGAFGQYIIVMPDQDAVVVITSETGNMQDELDLVWKYLLPAMQKGPLPVNKKIATGLKKQLSTAALPFYATSTTSPRVKEIAGKTFSLSSNAQFLQNMTFQFTETQCDLALKIDTNTYQLAFGNGKWVYGETTKLGPSLVARAKAHFVGLPPSKVAGTFRWSTKNTLELTLRYIDSPHTETFTCVFDQNNLDVSIQSSFNKKNPLVVKGSL
jgi:CubicO group peptidase (beta-lactamase class C family)